MSGSAPVPLTIDPLDSLFWLFDKNPHLKWLECEAQPELNGRRPRIPVAKLLGGGTSINTLMYNTPAPSDFDDWGQPGWTYNALEHLIAKTIRFDIPSSQPPHGLDGPIDVSYGGHTMDWGEEFRFAVEGAIPDIHQLDYITTYTPSAGHSVGRQPKLISSRGIRSNTAHAYIHSSTSPNLHVLTHVQISRIILEQGTATGVEVVNLACIVGGGHQKQVIRARKLVVLCCGTMGSPCVLERSGVGDPTVLKAAGVDLQVDLPGVGAELDDHQLTWGTYHSARQDGHDDYARGVREIHERVDKEWQETGQGIAGSNGFDWGYKVRPNKEEIKAMGPEFERYWEVTGANKPDKPLYSYGKSQKLPSSRQSPSHTSTLLHRGLQLETSSAWRVSTTVSYRLDIADLQTLHHAAGSTSPPLTRTTRPKSTLVFSPILSTSPFMSGTTRSSGRLLVDYHSTEEKWSRRIPSLPQPPPLDS